MTTKSEQNAPAARATLADVQPGGRVRLGDGLAIESLARELLAHEYAMSGSTKRADKIISGFDCAPSTEYAVRAIVAALSAQPSPGGQGDAADSRVRFDAWLESNSVDTTRWGDGAYTDPAADSYWRVWQAALSAQPSPGGQGDMRSLAEHITDHLCHYEYDIGGRPELLACVVDALAARQPVGQITDTEIDARLNALYREMVDSGQHNGGMSGVAWDRAVYRMASNSPARAVDLGKVRQLIGDLRTLDVKESTKNDNAGFVDLRCYWALLGLAGEIERSMADSQAVGNG